MKKPRDALHASRGFVLSEMPVQPLAVERRDGLAELPRLKALERLAVDLHAAVDQVEFGKKKKEEEEKGKTERKKKRVGLVMGKEVKGDLDREKVKNNNGLVLFFMKNVQE